MANRMVLDHSSLTPDLIQALLGLSAKLTGGAVTARLRHLLDLRVSQMNGCHFCIAMHGREALEEGDSSARVDAVAAWRDSPLFTEPERAALAWAETLTAADPDEAARDAVLADLRQHFDDAAISRLSYAVAAINAWNRLGLAAYRHPPVAATAATAAATKADAIHA